MLDAGVTQAFGVADGEILRSAIAVVDQGIARVHHAVVQGLLERIERQVGAKRVRHQPTMRRALEALPRIDIKHRLPEDERTCSHHAVELERFGEVVSEQLDIVPMLVRVLRHGRPRILVIVRGVEDRDKSVGPAFRPIRSCNVRRSHSTRS